MAETKVTPLEISNPYKASAYCSTAPSLSGGGFTKIPLNTENFDTNNNFDNATNYRYTAPFTGYYRAHWASSTAQGTTAYIAAIYKNGTEFRRGAKIGSTSAAEASVGSDLFLLTAGDYIELYTYTATTVALEPGAVLSFMSINLDSV